MPRKAAREKIMNSVIRAAAGALLVLASASAARATVFASQVISYDPGTATTTDPTYTTASSALGAPDGITGIPEGFPNVLSPFSPAYDPDQIVVIGEGGELTLKFPQPVFVGTGPAIGVISNAGLIDTNYPNGDVGSPAGTFGGGSAIVSVSQDGTHFVSLGVQQFLNPANYYLNAGPYDDIAPSSPELANFGQPFTGTVASFDGDDYPQILSTLDGSGGGTWLNLSGTGLTQVNYIQFSVPTDGTGISGTNGTRLPIDAVAIADGHLSGTIPVPIPSGLQMAIAGLLSLTAARWTRSRLSPSQV
ncbi:MAG: hypothetical protein ABSF29_02885 [Tepidisphaeraceae bacterium]|jgi:hypothetical protein